jgi:TetR/AcrR family transcriptional regulator, transcriptional repressor for nem operon
MGPLSSPGIYNSTHQLGKRCAASRKKATGFLKKDQHERGCLLLSANLERDTSDATLAEFLRDNQAEVEGIFREALLRARKAGELSRNADTKALARFFTVTIQGMRAMARLRSDRKSLEQVARVALATLEQ